MKNDRIRELPLGLAKVAGHGRGEMRFEAYHGTSAPEFIRIRPSERGYFGAGVYLTSRWSAAEMYAYGADGEGTPRILSLACTLRKPIRVAADYAAAEKVDLESPAGPLVEVLFGAKAGDLLMAARAGDGMFGSEIRDAALSYGHDGAVLTWPDGLQDYLVFDAEAIVIVQTHLLCESDTDHHAQERMRA